MPKKQPTVTDILCRRRASRGLSTKKVSLGTYPTKIFLSGREIPTITLPPSELPPQQKKAFKKLFLITPALPSELTPKQKNILEDIKQKQQRIYEHYGGTDALLLEKNGCFIQEREDYFRLMGKAIHNGLVVHPLVLRWLKAQWGVNNYKGLRKLKNTGLGLEKWCNQVINPVHLWIATYGVPLARSGYKPGQIHAYLKKLFNKLLDEPQNSNRLLRRLLTEDDIGRLSEILAKDKCNNFRDYHYGKRIKPYI